MSETAGPEIWDGGWCVAWLAEAAADENVATDAAANAAADEAEMRCG